MKLKKLSTWMLTGFMALSLTACGGSGQANSEAASNAEGANGKKQKVTAWAWDKNFNIAALEEAKAVYEAKNPDVEIEIVEFAQDDVIQKLNTGLSSGSTKGLPDIVLIEDYRSQTFLKSYPNSFMDLSDVTTSDKFAKYKLDFMTIDDKTYGIPFDAGTSCLFYRKDLIEQAGYTEADMQDLTWEKYIEIGKAVKEKTGTYMLTLDPNDVGQLRIMMQSAGSWYVKADGTTPDLEGNKALEEGMAIYKEMMDAGIVKTTSEWAQFVGAPNNGEVASVPTGCWFTSSIMGEESQSGSWRIAATPKLGNVAESVNASNIGGSSWYIIEGTEGGQAAKDFMAATFGGDNEFYQTILSKAGVIATYNDAQTGAAYDQEVPFFGNQKIYADIAGWSNEIPAVNYGLHTYAFEDIIAAQMQNVLAGADIKTCLQEAQKQAESQIR